MALIGLFSPQNSALAEHNVVKALLVYGKADSGNEPDAPSGTWFGESFVKPYYTPSYWMDFTKFSTRLKRCIEEAARSAVGLGIEAVPAPGHDPARRNLDLALQRDITAMERFITKPNMSFEPLTEVLYRVEYDYHGSGNGYLEVVEAGRAAGAQVINADHVPCVGVRVSRTRDRYVRLMANGRKIYFRRFGDMDPSHTYINKDTGEFYAELPADVPFTSLGTSIIHYKQYCPFDDYYGQPTVVSASNAVIGNKLASIWNINFLRNNAHIPIAVVVENGNLSPDSIEQIELFTSRDGSGISNAGKVMVLQPDMSKLTAGGQLHIRIEPLKMGVNDDASFLEFRDSNNMEIQEAFGLSDVSIGGGGGTNASTRNVAALRQITHEHVIEPRTTYHENPLNVGLAPKIGTGRACFYIHRAANLDALQQAGVLSKFKDGLTVNDVRRVAAKLLQDKEIQPVQDRLANIPIAELPELMRRETIQVTQATEPAGTAAGPTPTLKWLYAT